MRLAYLPLLASLSVAAVSQLVVPQQHPFFAPNDRSQQRPLAPDSMPPSPVGPAIPPGSGGGGSQEGGLPGEGGGEPPNTGTVILSDVLGRDRSINVFFGFTRDFAPITRRFDDAARNSTVLAPLNSAIEALPRKPWEDPADYHALGADAYEGEDGQERAQRNLRRFVEAHIVPVSPWPEKQKARAILSEEEGESSPKDQEIWWETTAEGKRVIQPGNIEVASVASTVANGQVWIIKGVRNYSS